MAALTVDRSTAWPAVPRWARLDDPITPARRRRARNRVYRRRRVAVAVLVALLAFAAGVVLALALMSVPAGGSLTEEAVEAEQAAREAQRVHYVVQTGDSLWSVAGEVAPGEDPRSVVDALVASRGTSTIVPGDMITWPVD